MLELISVVLVFFACSATARAAGHPSFRAGIVGGTIYALVLVGWWLVLFVLARDLDRSWQLVFAALAVPGIVSTAVAAVDLASASMLQVERGAITKRLGRTVNVLWLVVTFPLAVKLVAVGEASSLGIGLGLVMVPLLTLFVHRAVRPVHWPRYLALLANVAAVYGLGWYIAQLQGWGVGAMSMSAAYYSGWSVLAACGNIVSLGLTIRSMRHGPAAVPGSRRGAL